VQRLEDKIVEETAEGEEKDSLERRRKKV